MLHKYSDTIRWNDMFLISHSTRFVYSCEMITYIKLTIDSVMYVICNRQHCVCPLGRPR